MFVDITIVFIL